MAKYRVETDNGVYEVETEEPSAMVDGKPAVVKKSYPAYGGFEGAKRLAFGGVPAYMAGPGSEDVLPAVGQVIGGTTPAPIFGAAAGAGLGQAARQGARFIRGQGFDPSAINKEMVGTATGEALFRGIPRALFPKQFGGKARELAGKKIGELIQKVETNAPFLRIPKKPILSNIEEGLQQSMFERGPARTALISKQRILEGTKQPLKFSEAIDLERQLGREGQYATEATQGKFAKAPSAPKLNQAIKDARRFVSSNVDEAASQAGVPEFEQASKTFGKLASKYPEKDLQKLYSPTGQFVRGAALGGTALVPFAFGAGPLSAVTVPLVAWASLPPRYKTAIFRKGIDTPIGKGVGRSATILANEALRKLTNG